MTKQCKQCSKTFRIDDRDQEFYRRIDVPPPTLCPLCRWQRRQAWRNERNFYQRQCGLCRKSIVTVHAPDVARPVYCLHCWWSDAWDGKDYGKTIDWSRPFFEQYGELINRVPAIAMMNDNGMQSENCEYTYDFAFGKNAYLVISSWRVEDCMYGFQINRVKDVYDSFFVFDSELIYEGTVVEKSYRCAYVTLIKNCRDCFFGYDLQNCSDCLFSVGLRNKQYYIWNKPYSKSAYDAYKQKVALGRFSNWQRSAEEFTEFILKIPRRFANLVNCENSTGDHLIRASNTHDSYLYNELVNCRFCAYGDRAKDCYDIGNSGKPELCYESVTPDESYGNRFTIYCWKSQFIDYSENCHSSKELFGCVGLKKAKYCILNRQYSEQEYKKIKQKLIEHMRTTREFGEFFPTSLSPFAYNESVAQEVVPLSRNDAVRLGYRWREQLPMVTGKETIEEFSDNIADASEDIVESIARCIECQKNYKIMAAEFRFYQTMQLPLPRYCIDCRYFKRRQRINPFHLWHRQCMCTQTDHRHKGRCSSEFETTYSPERKELVYCEQCYQKEIY